MRGREGEREEAKLLPKEFNIHGILKMVEEDRRERKDQPKAWEKLKRLRDEQRFG